MRGPLLLAGTQLRRTPSNSTETQPKLPNEESRGRWPRSLVRAVARANIAGRHYMGFHFHSIAFSGFSFTSPAQCEYVAVVLASAIWLSTHTADRKKSFAQRHAHRSPHFQSQSQTQSQTQSQSRLSGFLATPTRSFI